jgi:hypothetical protein
MTDRGKPIEMKPQPSKKPKPDQTIADGIRLFDPKIERTLVSVVETRNLPAIQSHLRDYEVEYSSFEGFNFDAFVENLKGTGGISVGHRKFNLLVTTRSAWILSKENCANIYEDGMMNVDFKKYLILKHKTKPDSRMFLYHMMQSDIDNLQMASGFDKTKPDSLRPDVSKGQFTIDTTDFKDKLRRAQFLKGTEEGFDLQGFIDSIELVVLLFDHSKNPYYNVWANGGEDIFRLYVDCGEHDIRYFEAMFVLTFGREPLKLFREA